METIMIPGYRSIFGEPTVTYEELLKGIRSSSVISFCLFLHHELHAGLADELKNQERLLQSISCSFTLEQREAAIKNYAGFMVKYQGTYQGHVFGRRALLSMVVRECNRNDDGIAGEDFTPNFNFFQAYLLVVDALNEAENTHMDAWLSNRTLCYIPR